MKRELCALGLLLLLVAGAFWNLRSADRLTGRVADSLDRAEQAARQEDYALALQALQEGHALWDSRRSYTQVFFRHPDLDGLQEAFAALEQLLRQEDPDIALFPATVRGRFLSAWTAAKQSATPANSEI